MPGRSARRQNARPELTEPLARSAAQDAGNRHMKAGGRKVWNATDYNAAAREYERLWPRANPIEAAAALSEAFHGRPAAEVIEIDEELRQHEYLAALGDLESIDIDNGVTLDTFGGAVLASNEAGTQLYIRGGDQQVSLDDFDVDATKEKVVLGQVERIVYVTEKQHLGEEDKRRGPYEHELGEESGQLPALVYDTVNKKLEFVGGAYHIDRDMNEGRHSAGIRN